MRAAPHSVPLNILNVIQDICFGVICPDAHDLPVQLPIINHGICSQGLHLVHSSLLALCGANFNHIYRVIVSLQSQSSKGWTRSRQYYQTRSCMHGTLKLLGVMKEQTASSIGAQSTYRNAAKLLTLVLRVLPCLGQHAIVPVDVVRVEPQLVLLDVLLQRI